MEHDPQIDVIKKFKAAMKEMRLNWASCAELSKTPRSSKHLNETLAQSGCHAIADMSKLVEYLRKSTEVDDPDPSDQEIALLHVVYVLNWLKILLLKSNLNIDEILNRGQFLRLYQASDLSHKNLPSNSLNLDSFIKLSDSFMIREKEDV